MTDPTPDYSAIWARLSWFQHNGDGPTGPIDKIDVYCRKQHNAPLGLNKLFGLGDLDERWNVRLATLRYGIKNVLDFIIDLEYYLAYNHFEISKTLYLRDNPSVTSDTIPEDELAAMARQSCFRRHDDATHARRLATYTTLKSLVWQSLPDDVRPKTCRMALSINRHLGHYEIVFHVYDFVNPNVWPNILRGC